MPTTRRHVSLLCIISFSSPMSAVDSDGQFITAFMAYHESADPKKLLLSAMDVAISLQNDHRSAKYIKYINRYDWVPRITPCTPIVTYCSTLEPFK